MEPNQAEITKLVNYPLVVSRFRTWMKEQIKVANEEGDIVFRNQMSFVLYVLDTFENGGRE